MVALIILFEVALLAWVIVAHVRERQALKRFIAGAGDPDRLKDFAMQLPPAYRAPATQFAGELARKGSLDELIVQAVTQAANTSYGLSLALRIVLGTLLSFAVLFPLGSALIRAAYQIDESSAKSSGLTGSRAFLETKGLLEPAFDELHRASHSTAWVFVILVVIGTLHWLLNRSEAREARFIEALLQASIAARPGTAAPVASRLSELIAPQRGLGMPIAAFAFFFVASGAGWLLLMFTANVKEANAADVYSVWPEEYRPNITPPITMQIPVAYRGGGSPIPRNTVAALSIVPDRLEIAAQEVQRDKDGSYRASELQKMLSPFREGLSILASQTLPYKNLLEVMNLLATEKVERVYLVIERTVLVKGKPGGDRIYAGIPFRVGRSELSSTVFKLLISGSTVSIDPGSLESVQIDTHKPTPVWTRELNEAVRARLAKKAPTIVQPEVAVQVRAEDLVYDKLMEILSAADTTCERDADCGVPGLGLQFFLSPER